MHARALRTIVACLAALLGMALATSVDNVVSPQHIHHHHHRDFNQPRALFVVNGAQVEEGHVPKAPYGPVYRCHDPHPEKFGLAPPVEDCNDVIKQFAALTTDIHLKLVEGCYQIVSGNCTGLVCPQRPGESTVTGALAAQYMASPVRDECIAKGQRGWWIDGRGWGIGVYLT
ncbi:hypothetical protein GGR58DRAFT_125583 [Xylaria digitata]|nr:hypothetical protein GGR58DRAFT_125583 [Xylaria digitata]